MISAEDLDLLQQNLPNMSVATPKITGKSVLENDRISFNLNFLRDFKCHFKQLEFEMCVTTETTCRQHPVYLYYYTI